MTEQRMVDVELIRSAVEMLEEDLPHSDIALAPKELPVVQLIDKFRAIIASPNVGWQPIETAPKDGSDVLLYDEKVTVGAWCENPHPWNDGAWWIDGGQVTGKPTHWMPLPQPPKED